MSKHVALLGWLSGDATSGKTLHKALYGRPPHQDYEQKIVLLGTSMQF